MSIYVFGYGSLINVKTCKELYQIKNRIICPVTVSGMKRSFCVSSNGGKYKVLGVRESKKNDCNGLLIKMNSAEELANLFKREKNYIAKPLDQVRILFNYKKQLTLTAADQIICFYPLKKYLLTKKNAETIKIKPNYLNTCLEGASEQGEDFLQDFFTPLSV